jgi:DNA-binding PadR family transcriptional regulator
MAGLLARGLVEEVQLDGVKVYAPTERGRQELAATASQGAWRTPPA